MNRKEKVEEIHGKRVDITPLFHKAGVAVPDSTEIIETPGMYPYKDRVEDNWAYYTAVGFNRLQDIFKAEGKQVKNIGIVGICSGVEGLAAIRIFKEGLHSLVITDIDDEILKGTVFNLQRNSQDTNVQLVPLVGSFCEPIAKRNLQVDFVHANIPNLPALGTEDLTKGAEKGTFLPSQLYDAYNPPKEFEGWALAAQYAYLTSAKGVLTEGGSVITELGGRVPSEMLRKLFHATGLKMQEVIVGFKEQTEALIDFEGYHRLEVEHGTAFEFYEYEKSKALLQKQRITNPTRMVSGEEIKHLLEPYRVSAGKALELYKEGVAVGHTVLLLRGLKETGTKHWPVVAQK